MAAKGATDWYEKFCESGQRSKLEKGINYEVILVRLTQAVAMMDEFKASISDSDKGQFFLERECNNFLHHH